jgi:hypothetical protein
VSVCAHGERAASPARSQLVVRFPRGATAPGITYETTFCEEISSLEPAAFNGSIGGLGTNFPIPLSLQFYKQSASGRSVLTAILIPEFFEGPARVK